MPDRASLACLLICALLAMPAPSRASAPPPSTKVYVNDSLVTAKALLSGGVYYVAIEDLARALGATITTSIAPRGTKTITLNLTGGRTESKAKVVETGSIRGVVTYFFNRNYGGRPDAGAKVWLVGAGRLPRRDEAFFDGRDFDQDSLGIKATADGAGAFELTDILAGTYTLIIQSNHRSAFDMDVADMKNNLRDALGWVHAKQLTVAPGRAVDGSYEFGRRPDE